MRSNPWPRMMGRVRLTAGSAGLVGAALCLTLAAAPAGASMRPSMASVVHELHVANVALAHVRPGHSVASRRALARNRAASRAAARQAVRLRRVAGAATAARAFALVAGQYDRDVRVYTTLVRVSSGSLQLALAQALALAVAARGQALGLLKQLTSLVPGAITGVTVGMIGSGETEVSSLAGLVNGGGLPTQIQGLIAQALTTATGLLDGALGQIKSIIPTLPAQAQPIVTAALGQVTSALGLVTATLGQATQLISGVFGGTLSGPLSQVTSLLQSLIGQFSGLTAPGTGSTGTGTGSTGTGGFFGSLPIPPFVQTLLGQFGFGGMGGFPFPFAADTR